MVRTSVFAFCALVLMASPAAAKDWWGEKLPGQPTQFIFGYGTLMNTHSRNATAGEPIEAIPVRVSPAFGYARSWAVQSPSGFTALGLRKVDPGEKGSTINGVLYPVKPGELAKFDARESSYARLELRRDDIEAVSWRRLPETGAIWVYVPVGPGGQPGVGLPQADAEHPLLQSYIDEVVEGGLEYGEDFAQEVLETTGGWSQYWLNDRELARRPWVLNPQATKVDRLLKSSAEAGAKLKFRLFAESYALRWAHDGQ
jgi:hypothetical protein